jgi:hypothetical protein
MTFAGITSTKRVLSSRNCCYWPLCAPFVHFSFSFTHRATLSELQFEAPHIFVFVIFYAIVHVLPFNM